jgi:spoIIIJ-associated protein
METTMSDETMTDDAPTDSLTGIDGSVDSAADGRRDDADLIAADGDGDGSDSDTDGDGDGSEADGVALLVREGDIAADYLEQFLDIIDYDGDIDLDVENGRAVVAVVGTDLNPLIGPGGSTLDALQELTRLAVQQKTGARSRLMLDVSGHRSSRRKQLTELAEATAQQVRDSGEPVRLAPMNPFERKVVHDAISALNGVRSESAGTEPDRRVVVHPA